MLPPGSGKEPCTVPHRSLAVGAPDSAAVGDLFHRPPSDDRGRLLGCEVPLRIGVVVAPLDEAPLWAPRPAESGEDESALQPLAVHHDAELALLVAAPERFGAAAVVGFVGAAIPEHHRPAAILALRNRPL